MTPNHTEHLIAALTKTGLPRKYGRKSVFRRLECNQFASRIRI